MNRETVHTLFAASLILAGVCSCTKSTEFTSLASRFSVAKIDGGPLTTYAYNVKGRTKPVGEASLHRTFFVVNDADSPVQLRQFTFTTKDFGFDDHSCAEAHLIGDKPHSVLCAKLTYDLKWTYESTVPVAAWEFRNSVFDVMNRSLWVDESSSDEKGREAAGMEPGKRYNMDRAFWWDSQETHKLGDWLTSVVYVHAVRTKDGKVWNCDKEGLRKQIKSLSLEIPAELK